MKSFWSRNTKADNLTRINQPSSSSNSLSSVSVPPFPAPLPDRRLTIVATSSGLLVLPRSSHHAQQSEHPHHRHKRQSSSTSDSASSAAAPHTSVRGARLAWGLKSKVEQLSAEESATILDTSTDGPHIECYGIVGKLNLYQGQCQARIGLERAGLLTYVAHLFRLISTGNYPQRTVRQLSPPKQTGV